MVVIAPFLIAYGFCMAYHGHFLKIINVCLAALDLCHSTWTSCCGAWALGHLPREPQGLRGLVGCRPWGHTDSDTTETTSQQQQQQQQQQCIDIKRV